MFNLWMIYSDREQLVRVVGKMRAKRPAVFEQWHDAKEAAMALESFETASHFLRCDIRPDPNEEGA